MSGISKQLFIHEIHYFIVNVCDSVRLYAII
jgi:hypothetical protein